MKFESQADLTKWARRSERLWLFLDYDGTLADFAPTPEHIEPDPRIASLLGELAHRPGTRVMVLSGRRLAHVRRLLPVSGIMLAGSYGIELLGENGETINRLALSEVRPLLESIKPQWAQLIDERRGFFLEDKGWALALHARFAEDEVAARIIGRALEIATLQLTSDDFRILGGHKFLEVAPRLASKHEAVAYLLDRYPLPGARLVYIGDDDKDEEAFPLIHEHDGAAIKVLQPSQLSQPTAADYYFDSPGETLNWLEGLLRSD